MQSEGIIETLDDLVIVNTQSPLEVVADSQAKLTTLVVDSQAQLKTQISDLRKDVDMRSNLLGLAFVTLLVTQLSSQDVLSALLKTFLK